MLSKRLIGTRFENISFDGTIEKGIVAKTGVCRDTGEVEVYIKPMENMELYLCNREGLIPFDYRIVQKSIQL